MDHPPLHSSLQELTPSRLKKEGKKGKKRTGNRRTDSVPSRTLSPKEAYSLFTSWAEESLPEWQPPLGEPILFGDELYWLPYAPHDSNLSVTQELLDGLKIPRPGLHLAHVRKQRIEPSHALALSLSDGSSAKYVLDLEADSDELRAYLCGNTLQVPETLSNAKGWVLVTVDGLPLGWGKAADGILKNHYPKGLRMHNL